MRRILLDDDDASILDSLRDLLVGRYEVLVALDGEDALRVLAEAERPVDVIVLDMLMPVLDGAGFVRAARARGLTAPVILASATAASRAARAAVWGSKPATARPAARPSAPASRRPAARSRRAPAAGPRTRRPPGPRTRTPGPRTRPPGPPTPPPAPPAASSASAAPSCPPRISRRATPS